LLGRWIDVPFLVLAGMLSAAGIGWFRRRLWGWALGVVVLAIDLYGKVVHLVVADRVRSGVGLVIAGFLLFCLLRPGVRNYFPDRSASGA
jgi:hypothetical protein